VTVEIDEVTGAFNLTGALNAYGSETMVVRARDLGDPDGLVASDVLLVSISIENTPDLPIANNATAEVFAGQPVPTEFQIPAVSLDAVSDLRILVRAGEIPSWLVLTDLQPWEGSSSIMQGRNPARLGPFPGDAGASSPAEPVNNHSH
jgi:hypothetical protein